MKNLFHTEEERRQVLPLLFEELFNQCSLWKQIKEGLLSYDCWTMFASRLAFRLTAMNLYAGQYLCEKNSPVTKLYMIASNSKINASSNHVFKQGSLPGFASLALFGLWQYDLVPNSSTKVFIITTANFIELLDRIEALSDCEHGAVCLPKIPRIYHEWASKQKYANPDDAQVQNWRSIMGLKASLKKAINRRLQNEIQGS